VAPSNEPLQVSDLMDIEVGKWKESLLKTMFDKQMVTQILVIPIGLPTTKDKLVGANNKSGTYIVKSG